MEERHFSITVLAILVVVVVVAGGVGAGLLYFFSHGHAKTLPTAQLGDNLTVNYIGMFGGGAQAGRVFDTSIYAVVENNATYPKSLEYAHYGTPSSFTPLPVTNLGPTSGLITGFWQGLLGLGVNQTRIIVIPEGPLGYWPVNQSCFVSEPLVYSIPTVATYTPSGFTAAFPGVTPTTGLTFPDPVYGWTDFVVSNNATAVVVENLPTVGFSSAPNGWSVTVTNVTATQVTLANDLTPANSGLVLGHSKTGMDCGSSTAKTQFIVSSVDLATGTFVEDYNPETVGVTLEFQVTIVTLS
jgi:hypothetical protein